MSFLYIHISCIYKAKCSANRCFISMPAHAIAEPPARSFEHVHLRRNHARRRLSLEQQAAMPASVRLRPQETAWPTKCVYIYLVGKERHREREREKKVHRSASTLSLPRWKGGFCIAGTTPTSSETNRNFSFCCFSSGLRQLWRASQLGHIWSHSTGILPKFDVRMTKSHPRVLKQRVAHGNLQDLEIKSLKDLSCGFKGESRATSNHQTCRNMNSAVPLQMRRCPRIHENRHHRRPTGVQCSAKLNCNSKVPLEPRSNSPNCPNDGCEQFSQVR